MTQNHAAEIDRHFAWFEAKLSPRPAKFVRWLRRPSSRLVRIPLAILLVLGGIFSILPVLGLWMLPLGLLLQKRGERERAAAVFAEVKKALDNAPRHMRRRYSEWHAVARDNARA